MHKVMPVVIGDLKLPESLPRGTVNDETRKAYDKNMKTYVEANATARFIICSSVRSEAKQHILTCKSGKEMWDRLYSVYEQKNERRLDLLYTQLFSYHKDVNDDIATHVSKLQKIWQDLQEELKSETVGLPKSMLLNRILNTLPNEYLELKNAWESLPASERNIMSLTERLRLHEQRLKEIKDFKLEETTVAFIAKGNINGFGKKKPS
ncbi:hypothetical protein CBL_20110, partial [Carabus blaptoides fortunei]